MKLLTPIALLLSGLAELSAAFRVPNGTTNGIYVHTRHANGSHTHTSVSLAVSLGTVHHKSPSAKFRRDLPLPYTTIFCGNGGPIEYHLNRTEIIGAIKQFHAHCNSTLNLGGEGHDLYSVYGEALVFMCNYGGMWCKNDEFNECFNMVKHECGDHSGEYTGYVRIWAWYKSYGFDRSDNDVCR